MADYKQGVGSFAQGFMGSFNPAADRVDRRKQQAFTNARQLDQDAQAKQLFDMQLSQYEAQKQAAANQANKERATNTIMRGMMGGGFQQDNIPMGVVSPEYQGMQGQNYSLQQIMAMPDQQAQMATGVDPSDVNWNSIAGMQAKMTPATEKLSGDLANLKILFPEATGKELFSKLLEQKNTGSTGNGLTGELSNLKTLYPNATADELVAMTKTTTAPDPTAIFKNERQYAKEWEGVTKNFQSADQQFNTIIETAKDPSGVGDIGMIFAMMKMFDPGSVVRESEFALAQGADSIAGQLTTQYNKLKDGDKLRPEQRKKFLDLAERIYQSTEKLYDRRLGEYRENAKQYGFVPERAVADVKRGPSGGLDDAKAAADVLIQKYNTNIRGM